MRVLIVVPAIASVYGGTSKSVLELAGALGKQHIMVDLVTTNADGAAKLDVPLHQWSDREHYRIQYFAYWGWGDYKLSIKLSRWLWQHVSDYDVVHTHAIFSLPNLPAYWACQIQQVPYVVSPHGMLDPWALQYKAGKKRWYYKLIEKPALQKAAAIHLLTSAEAIQTKQLGLQRHKSSQNLSLVVIPNGVHAQEFIDLPSPASFYEQFPQTKSQSLILFLGRIDPKKGLDLLATAFTKVHSQFPNTHLVIAGPDNVNFLAIVQNYFNEAGSLESVTFTGMLTGELKLAALAAASLYIAPSYSEGFSMSILEGMAAGLPCVITTGCNFPEASESKAVLVVDTNSEAIATAMCKCLENLSEAKQMGDRARQMIFTEYTWDQIATKFIDLYKSVVTKSELKLKS